MSAITYAAPSRWYEVTKEATRMTLFMGGYGVVINQKRWNSLSDEHKDVIQKAMKLAEEWNYENAKTDIAKSEKMMTDNGVTITDLTDEELAAWREVMKPVYEAQPENIRKRIEQIERLKTQLN